jgi:short-subunit dehydrogenase
MSRGPPSLRKRASRIAGVLLDVPRNLPRRIPFRGGSLNDAVEGKTVMITGASSGIGRATALQIGEAGGIVLLVARSRDKLEGARRQIETLGGEAHVYPCDVSDMEDIDRMADEVLAEHDHVDVLVNNAGRSIRRSIELSYERFHDFERTMRVNYFGAVKLILRLLPVMRERRSGHIVNVSTLGVQTHVPRFSAYVASKAALDEFSRSIASEIVDDGVDVTTVYMPLVRTPMIAPTKIYNYFPAKSPEEAAEMICDAIAKRPKRASTAIGRFSEITYATVPGVQDAIVNAGYKLFPDTRAARGKPSKEKEIEEVRPEDDRATAEQRAFARLTRGVHW